MITQIAVLPNLPKVESFLPEDMAQEVWRKRFFSAKTIDLELFS